MCRCPELYRPREGERSYMIYGREEGEREAEGIGLTTAPHVIMERVDERLTGGSHVS